ncbi:MAG: MBL fold metallo-hydrolase [Desulfomonilaceae bacterium]
MTATATRLKPTNRVEITILVDNYVDLLLPDEPGIVRPSLAKNGTILSKTLLAEHGLSLLIDTWDGETTRRTLLDTGYNAGTLLHNMQTLDLDPKSIDALVISHGHMDHTGSVNMALEAIGKPIPIVCHPDMFRNRFLENPQMGLVKFPQLANREQMVERGAQLSEGRGPTLIAGSTVLVTGEIPRVTDFEKGMPGAQIEIDGKLGIDKIEDDQAIVINLAGCGLVVISGCAHSGIINSMLYAQKITGEEKVFGALGGFHLIGPDMEFLIESTVEELKKIAPKLIMPMHCTGRVAMQRLQSEFADRFVLSSVGTRLILTARAC